MNGLGNCLKNIVERLDKGKIKWRVRDIRNDLWMGKKSMNGIKFEFLERWVRWDGNLKSEGGEVIDKIVKGVIWDGGWG